MPLFYNCCVERQSSHSLRLQAQEMEWVQALFVLEETVEAATSLQKKFSTSVLKLKKENKQ